jgi:hypothetical protein
MMRKKVLLASAALLLLAAGACGGGLGVEDEEALSPADSSSQPVEAEPPIDPAATEANPAGVPGVPDEPTDWEGDPLSGLPHVEVASVSEAAALTPFEPVVPDLGVSPEIYVTTPEEGPDAAQLVLVFHSPVDGTVWVSEYSSGLDEKAITELAESQYCVSCTVQKLVSLAGGQQAAVIQQEGTATSIMWVQRPGLQITLNGPFDSLSPDSALAIANELSLAKT